MSKNVLEELTSFPCAFNIEGLGKLTKSRFKHIKNNVETDLDQNEVPQDEIIRNKNMLSWVLFNLENYKKASATNEEVLELSHRQNIPALASRVFMLSKRCHETDAEDILEELRALESSSDFKRLHTEALAEQAFYLSRMGGFKHCTQSVQLFEQVLQGNERNYLWKFGLGLMYRRLTHNNLRYLNTQETQKKVLESCANYLFDVADNADDRLKGLAYAQLLNLNQYYWRTEYKYILKNKSVDYLFDKAITYGSKNPSVLTHCGKSYKSRNLDKAIEVLEKSLNLRENTIAYHHLGLCYERKIDLINKGSYKSGSRLNHHSNAKRQLFSDAESRAMNVRHQTSEAPPQGHQTEPHCDSGTYHKPVADGRHYSLEQQEEESGYYSGSMGNGASRTPENPPVFRRYKSWDAGNRFSSCPPQRKLDSSGKQRISRSQSEYANPQTSPLKIYVKSPEKLLDPENELVKKAVENYSQAVEISRDENIPALVSLGMIYMRIGKFKEALQKFSLIISSELRLNDNLISVISAYENAGICCKEIGKTRPEYEQKAKGHFTQAISLAADLAASVPGLENSVPEIWKSYSILKEDIDGVTSPKEKNKKIIELCKLMRKYKDVVLVVGEMMERDEEFDDIEAFKDGLESHLNQKNFEDALVFLNLASTRPRLIQSEGWTSDEITKLKFKTLLCVTWQRLYSGSKDLVRIFQQMFQLKYGQCSGQEDDGNMDDDVTKHDLLLVYDENSNDPTPTATIGQYLGQVFNQIFGLDTSCNLQNNLQYNDTEGEILLEEMRRYRLVVLVLGDDSGLFKHNLKCIPVIQSPAAESETGTAVMIINTNQNKNGIPSTLVTFRCLQWEDLHPKELDEDHLEKDLQIQDLISILFDGHVYNLVKLFCFLVQEDFSAYEGKVQPLPPAEDDTVDLLASGGVCIGES